MSTTPERRPRPDGANAGPTTDRRALLRGAVAASAALSLPVAVAAPAFALSDRKSVV